VLKRICLLAFPGASKSEARPGVGLKISAEKFIIKAECRKVLNQEGEASELQMSEKVRIVTEVWPPDRVSLGAENILVY